jgi:hypothetical protein
VSVIPAALQDFEAYLTDRPARRAFNIIAQTSPMRAEGDLAESHRHEALALAQSFGVPVRSDTTPAPFGWDGSQLSAQTEAYVLLHEIAHYQLAPPERRRLIEFGLGPGPDTVDRTGAERAAVLHGIERDREEAMASLLGILWETALGHPALASFLDQNWLEGATDGRAARHFTSVLRCLIADGVLDLSLKLILLDASLGDRHNCDPHRAI